MHLNKVITSAGASYAWVGQVFHPVLGFFSGWALMVASAVFMVSGAVPAATATLSLIAPSLADDPATVSFVAAGWLVAVGAVIVKGIKLTSYTQVVMTVLEVGTLFAITTFALVKFWNNPAHPYSPEWLSLAAFTPELFATGALTAMFFFWGWDVTLNLGEETKNGPSTSGHGAVISMIIVMLLFMTFALATLFVLTDAEIEKASTNVVLAVAEKVFPKPWSYLAVIAVILSSIGTLETSILQFTRTLYAKGRDGVLHRRYAILHKTWQTPWVATSVIVSFGLVLLFGSSFYPTITLLIKDSVNAIGFQVAFYYSLTCLACVWHFRKKALKSISNFILYGIWPLFSAIFLIFVALYSIPTFDLITNLIGIGGIVLGVVPFLYNKYANTVHHNR
jgi:amino acid transporter